MPKQVKSLSQQRREAVTKAATKKQVKKPVQAKKPAVKSTAKKTATTHVTFSQRPSGTSSYHVAAASVPKTLPKRKNYDTLIVIAILAIPFVIGLVLGLLIG